MLSYSNTHNQRQITIRVDKSTKEALEEHIPHGLQNKIFGAFAEDLVYLLETDKSGSYKLLQNIVNRKINVTELLRKHAELKGLS